VHARVHACERLPSTHTHAVVKVGYQVRYDNLPGPLRKKGDRIFLTSLQFNW
jgi:hypothetical protein